MIDVERSELQRVNNRIPDINSSITTDLNQIKSELEKLNSNIKTQGVSPVISGFNDKISELQTAITNDLNNLNQFIAQLISEYETQETDANTANADLAAILNNIKII